MSQKTRMHYQAKWVFPVVGNPLENGIVTVAGGIIDSVSKSQGTKATVDLGEVALIPGLVNAHTHLEFSGLSAPLGHPGIEFTDWIPLVMQNRNLNSANNAIRALDTGIQESIASGVVAIGEVATAPIALDAYSSGVEIAIFMEQLGQDTSQIESKVELTSSFLTLPTPSHIQIGISPHAPYSVHPELFQKLIDLAVKRRQPIAMHLAETLAERQLLENQTGSFVALLQKLNAWNPNSFKPGVTILDYLKQLARANHVLVIHGNYLSQQEIALIAKNQPRMSVVYCPRTHAYFGHTKYPLLALLNAGINVAVGTDSRASNPDLNLFLELTNIARRHANISPAAILEMGTINGARSLRINDRFGSLEPGKAAQMNIVSSGCVNEAGIAGLFSTDSLCHRVTV